MRKRSLIAAFSLTLASCGAEAGPRGFVIPHGGGPVWLDGENGIPPIYLDTRIQMHKQALDQLKRNRLEGARVGEAVCALKQVTATAEDPAENSRYFTYLEESFRLAGLEPNRFRSFEFPKRIETGERDSERDEALLTLTRECGLVYLPAGDQTVMRDLWSSTPVHAALESVLQRGGGLMGNSAGGAILGSLVFFPGANDITSTRGILELGTRNRDNDSRVALEPGPFTRKLVGFPRIYVETHTDPRERVGRAAAFMAAWESDKETSEEPAISISLDIDVGVMVTWDSAIGAWIGEVSGGRSAEFLFPTRESKSGWPRTGLPYYTNLMSHVLFKGARVVLSGARRGEVLTHSAWGKVTAGLAPQICTPGRNRIHGDDPQEAWDASSLHFTGILPDTGEVVKPDWFEYTSPDVSDPNLFRTGHLRIEKGSGCGYWQPYAFNPDHGQKRDRLPMLRYALGLGYADYAVALPLDMYAEPLDADRSSSHRRSRTPARVEFRGLSEGGSSRYVDSSVFVYDVRKAQRRGVADYTYAIYDGKAPVQTGMWENGTVHLLPPRAIYDVASGMVTLPSSFR